MDKLDLNLSLYKKMYLCRKVEETIQEYYFEDKMKTPMHMSMGGEAISAGVCQALGDNSYVFGTYRSHALYLSKTGESDLFFAEMYGKETGVAGGKAGSMHLSNVEAGFIGASAIVGSNIPVAVGFAFSERYKNKDSTTAVFFGDGAVDEGTFWESLNIACLMHIPILFVCEDNGLAIHTSSLARRGYKSIVDVISKFNCATFEESSTDPEAIWGVTDAAMRESKVRHLPSFLNFKYYRYLEHVGVNTDFDKGYRSEEEFNDWYGNDPINLQRKKLIHIGVKEKRILEEEKLIDKQVEASVEFAEKSVFASAGKLFEGVLDG